MSFSTESPNYGVPFMSKLRFLAMFIKPSTFVNLDRSSVKIDLSLLEMAIHWCLLNIDRCFLDLCYKNRWIGIDRSMFNLVKIDRGLVKVAGLINIAKNRGFDTNGTPYRNTLSQSVFMLSWLCQFISQFQCSKSEICMSYCTVFV